MISTQEKLKYIISDYVDVDPDKIDMNMDLKFDIGLDSFGMISLICAIENEFGVSMPESACMGFNTLLDMAEFIDKRSLAFI